MQTFHRTGSLASQTDHYPQETEPKEWLGNKSGLELCLMFVIEDSLEPLPYHLPVFRWSSWRSHERGRWRWKLYSIPRYRSCAHPCECHKRTFTMGWHRGKWQGVSQALESPLAHTSFTPGHELRRRAHGALLLIRTPVHTFLRVIPWLRRFSAGISHEASNAAVAGQW
jgi:hypothetical protein